VTPFDPFALLSMLLAFYPAVSPAAFAQARRERPEYFAGGSIIGSKGDKLQLPDGRVFDCIFASGGPLSGQRWQVLDVTNATASGSDGFALEAGPLTPLDEQTPLASLTATSFEGIVADELSAFGDSDGLLHAAADAASRFDGSADLEQAAGELLGPAGEHHDGTTRALDGDSLTELLETTDAHGRIIDDTLPETEVELPDDINEPPEPGDPRPPETPPGHGEPPEPPPTAPF
jgi:hypothetical protein